MPCFRIFRHRVVLLIPSDSAPPVGSPGCGTGGLGDHPPTPRPTLIISDTRTLEVTGPVTVGASGTLDGEGTISSTGDVIWVVGTIAPGGNIGTLNVDGEAFHSVEGADGTTHIGQGAFYQGVRNVLPGGGVTHPILGVEVDLFVALGGDTNDDGDVWTEDWTKFRSNFSFGDYTVAEGGAASVPEPGTLAMLLASLIGLAVAVWRRRAA